MTDTRRIKHPLFDRARELRTTRNSVKRHAIKISRALTILLIEIRCKELKARLKGKSITPSAKCGLGKKKKKKGRGGGGGGGGGKP